MCFILIKNLGENLLHPLSPVASQKLWKGHAKLLVFQLEL